MGSPCFTRSSLIPDCQKHCTLHVSKRDKDQKRDHKRQQQGSEGSQVEIHSRNPQNPKPSYARTAGRKNKEGAEAVNPMENWEPLMDTRNNYMIAYMSISMFEGKSSSKTQRHQVDLSSRAAAKFTFHEANHLTSDGLVSK